MPKLSLIMQQQSSPDSIQERRAHPCAARLTFSSALMWISLAFLQCHFPVGAAQANKTHTMTHTMTSSVSYVPSDGDFSYIPRKRLNVKNSVVDPITAIYLSYNETPGFDHWKHYGKAYYENIEHLIKSDAERVRVLEIGVQSGGSSRVWKQLFQDQLDYTGLDINPACKQFERPEDHIRIITGSQLNETLLKELCHSHGPFDFIIDDGGHVTSMIVTSMSVLWFCLEDRGVYAIEDLHAGDLFDETSMLYKGHSLAGHIGHLLGKMEAYWKNQCMLSVKGCQNLRYPPDMFAKHIEKASKYDSLLFLHYREHFIAAERIKRGSTFIPYT